MPAFMPEAGSSTSAGAALPATGRRSVGFAARIAGAVALLFACFVAPAAAQQSYPVPRITGVFPAGAKAGAATEVQLSGADLDGLKELRFSHPGIVAAPVMKTLKPYDPAPRAVPNQFTITVAGDVPPGVYEFVAIANYGASPPRAFMIGGMDEVLEKEPNNDVATAQEIPLPCAVEGQSDPRNYDCYKFTLKAGARWLFDCWSYRLDSKMDPTLVVVDDKGREIARSRDADRLDPLVDFTAPADGTYTLKVFDFQYAGGAEYAYRLECKQTPHLEFALPAAGQAGTKQKVALYGRMLPGGTPEPAFVVDGKPLEKLEVEVDFPAQAADVERRTIGLVAPEATFVDSFEYRLSGPTGRSNGLLLGVSSSPTLVEKEPNNQPSQAQTLSLPCEVTGQFFPRGDDDFYSFTCKKGEVYTIEVISQRMGLPTDPYLVVQRVVVDKDGKETVQDLTVLDDPPAVPALGGFGAATDDPTVKFAAPEDGLYRIQIRDLYAPSRGSPKFVYRLAIRPRQPDFRLTALARDLGSGNQSYFPNATQIRKGGLAAIECVALRKDEFAGEIELSVRGLPDKVTAFPGVVGASDGSSLIVFQAADDAPLWSGPIEIVGKGKYTGADGKEVVLERKARCGAVTWPQQQNQSVGRARMAQSVQLSVLTSEEAPYSIEIEGAKALEACRGSKLTIPVKLVRRGEFKQNVQFEALDWPNVAVTGQKTFQINNPETAFKWEVRVRGAAPLGRYQLALKGQANLTGYRRNPAPLEAAKAEQQRAEEYRKDREAAFKAAQEAKGAADRSVNETAGKAKALEASAKAAKAAADKEPGNPNLVQARDAAAKALEEAQAAAKAAVEAKAKAEQAMKEGQEALKVSVELKQQADRAVTEATTLANPRNFQVNEPSAPIVFSVAAYPIDFKLAPPPLVAKTKIEVPVEIKRNFEFAEGVTLQLHAPPGFPASSPQITIPKEKSDGKVVIDVGDKPPPGNHVFTLKSNLNFGGEGVNFEMPVPVTVNP